LIVVIPGGGLGATRRYVLKLKGVLMPKKYKKTILHCKISVLPVFPLIFLFLLAFNFHSLAQEKLTTVQQKVIIDSLCTKLEKLNPINETGKKTSLGILKNYEDEKYSDYTLLPEFIQRLNDDLESLSKDGHLGIIYDPAMASELRKEGVNDDKGKSYADLTSESERWNNFGFKELKILEGNVGYGHFFR
jgi:hypothetical protein